MYPFCHHIKDRGERILIPGCMGTAVYGIERCTCPHPGIKNAEIRKRRIQIEKLEEEIREIEITNGIKYKP